MYIIIILQGTEEDYMLTLLCALPYTLDDTFYLMTLFRWALAVYTTGLAIEEYIIFELSLGRSSLQFLLYQFTLTIYF